MSDDVFDCTCMAYLVKKLFASCAGQDGKLQLCIHGCNSDIYLPEKNTLTKRQGEMLPAVHSSASLEKHQRAWRATGWKKKSTTKSVLTLFVKKMLNAKFLGSFTAKKKKESVPYILLFNQEHPIARGWWGLQSKNEAHSVF